MVPAAIAAALLIAPGIASAQKDTTEETDRAMTAFAAHLRNSTHMDFQVNLAARSVTESNAEPLANAVFDVSVQRPNILRITPVQGSRVSLVSNGSNLTIEEKGGKTLLDVSAPPSFDGFRRVLPKSLGIVEQSVFSTVAGILSNDPAGFVVGESLERSKYANFMLDGKAGEMFKFTHGKTETLVGLSANARPELLRLTTDTNTEAKSGVVVNYSFRNWSMVNRGPQPAGNQAGANGAGKPGTASDTGASRPKRTGGIKIEDAPTKPK